MKEYCYCTVNLKGIYADYAYISEFGLIPLESYVVVPFGKNNQERVGKVISCDFYEADNVPYPVERTKSVIRYADENEIENYRYEWETDFYDFDEIDYYISEEDWESVLEWCIENHESTNKTVIKKVIEGYTLCAEQNMPTASLNLGTFYYTGVYVKQDYKKAFELYKIAADAGYIRAICNCGYCFYYGRHQEVDYKEAYNYFVKGALLCDDENCLYKIGDMYLSGKVVEKNEIYAYIIFKRALEKCLYGNGDKHFLADLYFRVGKCKLYGIGTCKNTEEAQEYLANALTEFYKRRKTDPFVAGLINSTREMLQEAQEILNEECI